MIVDEPGKKGCEEGAFSFGRNWEEFVQTKFSEERVEISRKYMLEFLGMADLDGKRFLDIGCGSGIHSLAAFRSRASRVASLDIDPDSVKTTERIREKAGNPPQWEVMRGSILDAEFVARLEPADVVYSWGVLHHTGNLWEAVRNSARLIRPGGHFYIALYEKTPDSDYWIAVKKKYNRASPAVRLAMEVAHFRRAFFNTWDPRTIADHIRVLRNYRKKSRGMAVWTDIRDWLGGWPYEPATPQEVTDFCTGEVGLRLVKVKTGEANVEYLFTKAGV